MILSEIKVSGDRRVEAIFDDLPNVAHEQIVSTMHELIDALYSKVEDEVPKGKRRDLPAIVQRGVEDHPDRVRAWLSLAGGPPDLVRLAAALEYGSTGRPFAVKQYARRLDEVFGKSVDPFVQIVEAYRRAGGLEAVEFLRGPLHSEEGNVLAELNRAFDAAVKEASHG